LAELNSYKLLAFRMAPRKRKSIGRVNPNSLRMKLLRAAETPQQRQARLPLQNKYFFYNAIINHSNSFTLS
jgi:hypothetical protein